MEKCIQKSPKCPDSFLNISLMHSAIVSLTFPLLTRYLERSLTSNKPRVHVALTCCLTDVNVMFNDNMCTVYKIPGPSSNTLQKQTKKKTFIA